MGHWNASLSCSIAASMQAARWLQDVKSLLQRDNDTHLKRPACTLFYELPHVLGMFACVQLVWVR